MDCDEYDDILRELEAALEVWREVTAAEDAARQAREERYRAIRELRLRRREAPWEFRRSRPAGQRRHWTAKLREPPRPSEALRRALGLEVESGHD